MESDWKESSLADLYNVSSGLSKPASAFGSGYPFLGFKDVFYNYFTPDRLSDLVQSSDKEREKCSVKRGDVFLTRTSETMHELGMSCVALKNYENATFNGFTKRLRPKEENDLVPEYVGYYLRSRKFRQEMLAFSTMSTRASLNNGMIAQLHISYPDVDTQKAIANILGSLDDKIELNRQMNATLEAIAQTLFKSWFVNFDPVIDNALAAGNPIPETLQQRAEARKALGDQRQLLPEAIQQQFPNSFVFNDDLGWVPEGWKIVNLRNVTSTIIDHRGKTPKKMGGDWVDFGYPAISAKNIKTGRIIKPESIRFVSEEMYKNWMKEELRAGDIALTSEAPLGEAYYFATEQKYVLSQRLFGVRADNTRISGSYLYHWLRSARAQADMENRATGTTVTGIRQSELQNVFVLQPRFSVVEAFTDFCGPTLIAIEQRELEAKSLSETRDKVLPKLLSGQLRIPDAEKRVAEVLP